MYVYVQYVLLRRTEVATSCDGLGFRSRYVGLLPIPPPPWVRSATCHSLDSSCPDASSILHLNNAPDLVLEGLKQKGKETGLHTTPCQLKLTYS